MENKTEPKNCKKISLTLNDELDKFSEFILFWKKNGPRKMLSPFWWDKNYNVFEELTEKMQSLYESALFIKKNISDIDEKDKQSFSKELWKAHNSLFKICFNYHDAILIQVSVRGQLICDLIAESMIVLIKRGIKFDYSKALVCSTNIRLYELCAKNVIDTNVMVKLVPKTEPFTIIDFLYEEFRVSLFLLKEMKRTCKRSKIEREMLPDYHGFFGGWDQKGCQKFLKGRIEEFKEKCKLLIEIGLDPNLKLSSGDPMIFKPYLSKDTIEVLLHGGTDINCKNSQGMTLLMYGFSSKDIETFIEFGANIDLKDNFGRTALFHAQEKETAEIFIANGADVNSTDNHGRTPLSHAHEKEMAEFFITNGADVNCIDNLGRTPIFYVSSRQYSNFLIKNGANVNIVDNDGSTPIFYARNMECLRVFKKHGLSEIAINNRGHNLFFTAGLDCYAHLKKSGVNINHIDNDGRSAIYFASKSFHLNPSFFFGNLGYVDALIENGIDLTLSDNHGLTPLQYWTVSDDIASKDIAKRINMALSGKE